jgi:hypothetical protein
MRSVDDEGGLTMMTRRQLLRAAAAAAIFPGIAATSAGCSGTDRSEEQSLLIRGPLMGSGQPRDVLRDLVRCATLAANGHNTQPWRFHLEAERISISPDFSRRTPAVDPDDHHLWVSLGCAVENMVQAAGAAGKHADVEFADQAIHISLITYQSRRSPLLEAIFRRQCTRADYDGRPLPTEAMHRLASTVAEDGIELRLLTERAQIEAVLEYVTAGNSAQMRDPAFVSELKHWIRFNGEQALESGDGLFTRSSGNPESPSWLGAAMLGLFFNEKSENAKYVSQIRSSAGVAILTGARSDPASWINVGRAYERLALTMTMLGIRNAFVNQPVEVPAVRGQFAGWLGAPTRRPDLVFRFGTGPLLPYSLRRPVDHVIS